MDTKSLRLFLHLAETLHFGRTSDALNVSPSTLSRVIQRLEEELGVTVFTRDNRRVALTEKGRLFQQYALQQLQQRALLEQQLREPATLAQGTLTLYCSVTAVYGVLSPVLAALRRGYPDIELQLHTGDQAEAVSKVLEAETDIAIAAKPEKLPSRLGFQLLRYSALQFIGPNISCAVAEQCNGVEAEALLQQPRDWWQELPFILPERGLVRQRCLTWLKEMGVEPAVTAQVSGNEAIVSMVSLGLGVAVVPALVLQDSVHAKQVRVMSEDIDGQPLSVGVVYRKEDANKPLIEAFLRSASS